MSICRVFPLDTYKCDLQILRPTVTLSTPRSESLRLAVMLSTPSYIRTRERNIPMLIKFVKPVSGVKSSIISITGGHIQRQVILFTFVFVSMYINST